MTKLVGVESVSIILISVDVEVRSIAFPPEVVKERMANDKAPYRGSSHDAESCD